MPLLSPAERRWAWCWALVVAFFASLPYLGLLAVTPPDTVFWGFVNNPDDHCVYLAWMRQAEQGQLFFQNLFTGDPQRGLHLNLFFWLLGTVGRLTHLPLALVYHLARFGFGALLLVLVYYLAAFLTPDRDARRAAFGFAALSSGLAWLRWPPADPTVDPGRYPADAWQPEAITFLSLYSNALFCASMAAMVGLYLCLLLAQRTGKTGYVVGAGLLGLLLGNIHSYDVISIAAVWAVYLLVTGLYTRRVPVLELRHALLAAVIGLPSVLYQYYLLQTDPVFQARAAVPTPSPSLVQYMLGYGLLIPLGVIGARSLLRSLETPRPAAYLPIIWAVVGLAVAYLPTAFQRKLVEGLHLPIALLAGFGAVWLARRVTTRPWQVWAVTTLILALTVPSNLRFVAQNWQIAIERNVGSTWLHAVFWPKEDLAAMSRLAEWVPPAGLIQALPWTSCLIPAMSGRRVWAGHWGETPSFESKFRQLRTFFDPGTPSDWRRQFLSRTGITHIFVGTSERALAGDSLVREPFLQPVHRLGEVMLYKVALGSR